jgi:4-diphosphocytidyl-2-C-methyl-D-erythritol kinase
MSPLRETAPAKVNLSLRVVGKRDDGYHLLDSLVAFGAAADTLTVSPADTLTLRVDGPFAAGAPPGPDNLVTRAAHALARAAGITAKGALRLEKALPVAAGIGGGSADAAAALRLLSEFWDVTPAPEDLHAIAASLGADVPVCLVGRACRMTGIGETLQATPPLPRAGLLLANPGAPCPTPAVFKARRGPFSETAPAFDPGSNVGTLVEALRAEPNDLTEAAITVCPEIEPLLAALSEAPGALMARMSGSGATCFALFETPEAAEAARVTLGAPGRWLAAGALLG